jgi:hypothetical protein
MRRRSSGGALADFVTFAECQNYMRGKRVAVVGSAPSVLHNKLDFIDSHEVVVRVNNFKVGEAQGFRTDVFYSFFGGSIKKTHAELKTARLCMCKLPNSKPLSSEWHESRGKHEGVDYRYIYRRRAGWWFCQTFVPDDDRFLAKFELLGKHQPTTGFAAILDVLACEPAEVYLTGFDFFNSGLHNVDEKWRPKNPDDPIRHRPDLERAWLRENMGHLPVTIDRKLREMLHALA